jgi:cytoskeletal protein CcmA (bactofilin family)
MTCASELNLSMYADGALTADAAAATQAHLAVCPLCSARLETLRAEADVLAMALAHEAHTVVVPSFERPARHPALATAALLLVAATLVSAAPALLGALVPAPLAWLNPFDAWNFAEIALRTAIYLTQHGDAIMTSITETAAIAVVIGFVAWLAFGLRKRRPGALLLGLVACAIVGLPTPSQALEIRYEKNGQILIPAGETIADTLIAVGDNVEVDGNVEGDLIAFGRRVAIRGRVGGQLITGASIVTIDGEVDGSVLGFARTLDVAPTRIGRNLYGFANTIDVSPRLSIEQNVVVFAQRAEFAGAVGRDILGFAEEIDVGSTIGGKLTVFADRVTLLAPARIAGDMTAHVRQADHVTISPGAVIGGKLETDIRTHAEHGSRYTTGEFYGFQVLRFAAAFVTGLILLVLVPNLRRTTLDTAGNALVAGGVGLVTLVAAPIIAVLVAITIIGIPLALLGFLLWLAGIYLAKVLLAFLIGARLIETTGNTQHFAVALALGLLLVILVINLPFIGGLLNFVLTICGLGLLVLFLWRAIRAQRSTDDAEV